MRNKLLTGLASPARAIVMLFWRRRMALLIFAIGVLSPPPKATADEFTPYQHLLELTLGNFSSYVARTSQVHIREDAIKGSRFHLASDLGIHRMDIPGIVVTYWLDEMNALQIYFRYFDAAGSHRLHEPAAFNGAVLTAGQLLSSRGTLWMDGILYYERRITPWLQRRLDTAGLLDQLDLRVELGLEFTYIDFRLNNGRAHVTPLSPKGESAEDFFLQELPMPTLGMEVFGKLSENLLLVATVKGNWINHWNSLRNEGGTVYTSQWSLETHWRLFYINPAYFGMLKPFFGLGYLYYRQNEQSHEDGNFLRLSAYGPEFGVSYSF